MTRDGTAEPVSRYQINRRERGQKNIHFSCSADHELNWQPFPVDPHSCYNVMTILSIKTAICDVRCSCVWGDELHLALRNV